MKTVAACLVNERNQPLPYTTQSTMSQCEEFCKQFFPAWDKMLELGCKVVQIEITVLGKD